MVPKHPKPLKWPQTIQNGPGQPPNRVQRGCPHLPPDNCQLPTDNCQPQSTANRHQPPTTNHQPPSTANRKPGQMGPKTVTNRNFQQWTPTLGQGETDLFGPFWACFDPCSAIVSRFGPVPTWAQNQSKMSPFKSGPRPFERVKQIFL